jgi:hypothetical protein
MTRRAPQLLLAALLAGCVSEAEQPPAADAPRAAPPQLVAVPAVLVGAGDIASCAGTGDEDTAALLDSIPGIVFTVGDNVYPDGSGADFAKCYEPSWGRHKARTRPAPGNHEYYSPGAAPYFAYFGAAASDPARGYYSYDLGAWHVVVLNTTMDLGPDSPQLSWLRADLAASTARCVVAYGHLPRFSSGSTHSGAPLMQSVWDVLVAAGAEILISGHEHHYERFAPQSAAGVADSAAGVRQFVVGTGGARLYPFNAVPAPNSEARGSARGVLKLTLDSTAYAWEFVPAAGETFRDAGSAACH